MIHIIKRTNVLEDGSKTFDVEVTDAEGLIPSDSITLHAISEQHAEHLMETLRAAVVNYTNDVPSVSHEETW